MGLADNLRRDALLLGEPGDYKRLLFGVIGEDFSLLPTSAGISIHCPTLLT